MLSLAPKPERAPALRSSSHSCRGAFFVGYELAFASRTGIGLGREAFGARLFRRGKPRAVLEVKSGDISLAFHDARLRGYDRAKAEESAKRSGTKAERRE